MTTITGITDQPNQQFNVLLPDGSQARWTLNYRAQQAGWFADMVWVRTNGAQWALNGIRLVTTPNLLRQYQNLLPFGFAIFSEDNQDPTTVKAFSSGLAQLVLLTQAEVEELEAAFFTNP